jgi:hypothetical protein
MQDIIKMTQCLAIPIRMTRKIHLLPHMRTIRSPTKYQQARHTKAQQTQRPMQISKVEKIKPTKE